MHFFGVWIGYNGQLNHWSAYAVSNHWCKPLGERCASHVVVNSFLVWPYFQVVYCLEYPFILYFIKHLALFFQPVEWASQVLFLGVQNYTMYKIGLYIYIDF